MRFRKASSILEYASREGVRLSGAMARYESENSSMPIQSVYLKMGEIWAAMNNSTSAAFESPERIELMITENDSLKLAKGGRSFFGQPYYKAMQYALSSSALNASMGKVAACPTGGSCGIVPGCIRSAQEAIGLDGESAIEGLLASCAVGLIVYENATVSGALGGCQAEVGTAAAMASAAVCEMLGASPSVCFEAASIALKSLMGLICDPVASLVESPCSKRNATGAALALSCAEMAMAGITSIIPFDEVVEAMAAVGKKLPEEHRETSEGGIAKAPTALQLAMKALGSQQD
ncbi:MAG: L-serine ammonia-lyase, iron-sulfur-dependent, subunit alpha [Eubacteriaceae bacterium]|jgi:L-serine dehydratase|nr:L-serine ammonia-lyase, iron-sulfur-dependent, subunit alpha [Eubacteriaceae bacterium]